MNSAPFSNSAVHPSSSYRSLSYFFHFHSRSPSVCNCHMATVGKDINKESSIRLRLMVATHTCLLILSLSLSVCLFHWHLSHKGRHPLTLAPFSIPLSLAVSCDHFVCLCESERRQSSLDSFNTSFPPSFLSSAIERNAHNRSHSRSSLPVGSTKEHSSLFSGTASLLKEESTTHSHTHIGTIALLLIPVEVGSMANPCILPLSPWISIDLCYFFMPCSCAALASALCSTTPTLLPFPSPFPMTACSLFPDPLGLCKQAPVSIWSTSPSSYSFFALNVPRPFSPLLACLSKSVCCCVAFP
ncbi:MAG: hypothetical protein J3R72DRAFT_174712 [Linnemannia gamsii]|nr:MAG: hypothetical protein J3R72DRAFT_174712 [Linnemannia gamsii]